MRITVMFFVDLFIIIGYCFECRRYFCRPFGFRMFETFASWIVKSTSDAKVEHSVKLEWERVSS